MRLLAAGSRDLTPQLGPHRDSVLEPSTFTWFKYTYSEEAQSNLVNV